MTQPTMLRRRFLTAIGIVGTATIAGCSGGGGDGGTPTKSPSPSPTPTPTTPNQQAVEHYNEVIDALVSIKETLDPWAEEDGFHGGASDIRDLRITLETANDDLEFAEEDADPEGELIERIEQAKLVATLQEGLIAFFDLTLTLGQAFDRAVELQENEQHERAAEKWREAEQAIQDARALFDDTETVLQQINHDVLNEPDLDYTGDLTDYIAIDHRQELDALESYHNAWEQINLAFVQLAKGAGSWENEAWVGARTDWEAGRRYLQEAKTEFKAVTDNEHAGDEIHRISVGVISSVETYIDGFDKLIEATHEAESGNLEKAEQLVEEGFDIIGQV